MTWLRLDELRIGLGCMRLPADEQRALETIAAAVDAGITVFDTARAYEGNEALLARTLRTVSEARVVTKGGMARTDGGWMPDGRARSIRADCEASLAALDGRAIDLYLLHTPDPRVELTTSIRALARLVSGLYRRVSVTGELSAFVSTSNDPLWKYSSVIFPASVAASIATSRISR